MSEPVANVQDLQRRARSGATWFYWIAALSAVNSIITLSGQDWVFILGLGITQVFDAIGLMLGEKLGVGGKIIGFAVSAIPVGLFALFGFFACRHHRWAFITGAILFGLDGVLFLLTQQWIGVAFHVFALLGMVMGLRAVRELALRAAVAPPPLPGGA